MKVYVIQSAVLIEDRSYAMTSAIPAARNGSRLATASAFVPEDKVSNVMQHMGKLGYNLAERTDADEYGLSFLSFKIEGEDQKIRFALQSLGVSYNQLTQQNIVEVPDE